MPENSLPDTAVPADRNNLWPQVLAIIASKVGVQTFHTWFQPLILSTLDHATCQLTVPTETFRTSFLENCADVLRSALTQVFGTPQRLLISIQPDEPSPFSATLPVVQACKLKAASHDDQWLIENLWMAEAVGIVGGPPRSYKTWLALDIAVSVASGSPCLGAFPVCRPGPVLLYAAEDSDASLRARLESIARSRRIDFNHLDVRVITADLLRLDHADDQHRFETTVALHKPVLVILDPLVRIHAADENASSAVAALLGYFRSLQRKTKTAVLLVHHVRKNLSLRTGYSLRGSSDFYAWTDCLLSLDRRHEQRRLVVEHRSAQGSGPFTLQLVSHSSKDDGLHLAVHQIEEIDVPHDYDSLGNRILNLLAISPEPLSAETIRLSVHVRKQRLLHALRGLLEEGKIIKPSEGCYSLKLAGS
jgi:hypothetical protein